MVIIETSVFTKRVVELLTDDEYRELQMSLILHPQQGRIIQGTGGLRKVRCGVENRGKSGGARVIYYWIVAKDQILMMHIYPKNEAEDLTSQQKMLMRRLVEEELRER